MGLAEKLIVIIILNLAKELTHLYFQRAFIIGEFLENMFIGANS